MSILRPRVTIEDIEPAVLRCIEVCTAMRLDRLHLVLQAAMPWQNYYLWEFHNDNTRWGLPDPDYGDDVHPAAKVTLGDVALAADGSAIGYLYDFGDSWQHRIVVEDRIEPAPRHLYPGLTDVEGRCPPENVGGFPGYERFLGIRATRSTRISSNGRATRSPPISRRPTSYASTSSSSQSSGNHAPDRRRGQTLTSRVGARTLLSHLGAMSSHG